MAVSIFLSVLGIFSLFVTVLSSESDTKQYKRAVTTTPKPVMCINCTDLECFTSEVSLACPKTSYCISTVTDHNSGTRGIVKGCGTLAQCTHAYNTTRLNVRCHGIEHQVSGLDITCSYCCKGDNCNIGPQLKPNQGVQFIGKAILG